MGVREREKERNRRLKITGCILHLHLHPASRWAPSALLTVYCGVLSCRLYLGGGDVRRIRWSKGKKSVLGQTGAAYNVRDIVKAHPMITYRIGVPVRKVAQQAQRPSGLAGRSRALRLSVLATLGEVHAFTGTVRFCSSLQITVRYGR